MSQYNEDRQQYLTQVCQQIRWKKAHAMVEMELRDHIEDQKEVFLAGGMEETEAEAMAVREMGSPLETGSRFDRLYRPKLEWNLLLAAGVLLVLGTVLRLTLLTALGQEFTLVQELWALPVGLALVALGYWMDYTVILLAGWKAFFLFAGVYLALLQFPMVHGKWIGITYLALLWPLLFCAAVYQCGQRGMVGFLFSFFLYFFSAVLFLTEGYVISGLLVMVVGGIGLLYGLRKNWFGCSKWWGLLLLTWPSLLAAMILYAPYRIKRFAVLFDPYSDADGAGYVACQLLEALQSIGWTGGGVAGIAQMQAALPVDLSTGYLLTAITGYYGWLGVAMVLLAYGALLLLCWQACKRVKSTLGRLTAISILSTWLLQLLSFTVTNLTSVQMVSYPMLFVQGDIALLCNLFLLGILLSVYKTGAVETDTTLAVRNSVNRGLL